MAKKRGRIVGPMTYREGDGMEIEIRQGPCEIDETPLDVTLTWTDGNTHGSTAIPLADYKRYVSTGVLSVDD
jgi:hypothetical protein